MEQPLCKICYPPRRHKMGEAHIFPASMLNGEPDPRPAGEIAEQVVAEKKWTKASWEAAHPPKKIEGEKPAPMTKAERKRSEWDGCPHCAERRAKEAERVKRWRQKQKKP